MELVKNIFFNTDKLVENTKVKISYTGKFFEDSSEEVYLHYGFGLQWDHINEVKMEKTELGFQTEIELISSDSLNFCFRNGNNQWDNNEYQNYSFPIEKAPEVGLVVQDDSIAIGAPRRLRKTYIWSKKIRIAVYKIITYLPKLISGNYKRKVNE
ncbi:MAG: carbohydrate binding domain-containing protein [Clostridia bacterium]